MAHEPDFVDAYSKRTGKKLPHPVPATWVDELAGITNLSRTPRGKKADAESAATTTETKE